MIWVLVAVFALLALIGSRVPVKYFQHDPHSQPVLVFISTLLAVVFFLIGLVSHFARTT